MIYLKNFRKIFAPMAIIQIGMQFVVPNINYHFNGELPRRRSFDDCLWVYLNHLVEVNRIVHYTVARSHDLIHFRAPLSIVLYCVRKITKSKHQRTS